MDVTLSGDQGEVQDDEDHVDELDAHERHHDAAQAVDEEVVPEEARRPHGSVLWMPRSASGMSGDDD